jgi:pyrroline-5-carboxylate reductase
MSAKISTIGFIGGGRITRIILQAFTNKSIDFELIKVFDRDKQKMKEAKSLNPKVENGISAVDIVQSCQMIFLALHPQDIPACLEEIKTSIKADHILISLAPKITMANIQSKLPVKCHVVRMITNAPSIINKGYNAIAFSEDIIQNTELRSLLCDFFNHLGECVQTEENNLEAYAVITGMGPTYLWFQFNELIKIAKELGLSDEEARNAVSHMVKGSVDTLLHSELNYEDVLDLIPFHPFGQHHETIKKIYREVLTKLHEKIKPV